MTLHIQKITTSAGVTKNSVTHALFTMRSTQKNDVQYYQGKDDVFNQAVAAGILTLKENGHSDDMLRDMTDEDQRNTLITKVAACDKKSVSYVQSFSTFVLVQYMNDNTRCCESTCARLTQKDWTHWCKYNCYYTYQWSHAAEAKCCK